MTQGERDRITALEVKQDQVLKELGELKKSVEGMKLTNAKLGGVGLALTGVGAVVGWLLTQAKSVLQIFPGVQG